MNLIPNAKLDNTSTININQIYKYTLAQINYILPINQANITLKE